MHAMAIAFRRICYLSIPTFTGVFSFFTIYIWDTCLINLSAHFYFVIIKLTLGWREERL